MLIGQFREPERLDARRKVEPSHPLQSLALLSRGNGVRNGSRNKLNSLQTGWARTENVTVRDCVTLRYSYGTVVDKGQILHRPRHTKSGNS